MYLALEAKRWDRVLALSNNLSCFCSFSFYSEIFLGKKGRLWITKKASFERHTEPGPY